MFSKLIKICLVVAILMTYLVSMSSATCPWFLRGELYYAKCGLEKAVPASGGILANDPQAIAVLDPETIHIDPKYGTVMVAADGSFVFSPSPDIRSGTYVQFKYNALNGECQAKYPATAKFQIVCSCRANAVDATIIAPESLDQVRAELQSAGAACWGCGDVTPLFDLRQVSVDASGMPLPGTYPYLQRCGSCTPARATLTISSNCQADAPDFSFCAGTISLEDFISMAEEQAVCSDCDQVPVLDLSGVLADREGYVTGGSYQVLCGDGESSDSDTGTITVLNRCDVNAPDFTICEGTKTIEDLQDMIRASVACTGDECDATPIFDWPEVIQDGNGMILGDASPYIYTVTCTSSNGCESSAEGSVTIILRCDCELIGIAIGCITPEELEECILDDNQFACGECDATPRFDFPDWPLDRFGLVEAGIYTYMVTCDSDDPEECDSECMGEIIIYDCMPV